jgi:hypothetical protein
MDNISAAWLHPLIVIAGAVLMVAELHSFPCFNRPATHVGG